MTTTLYDLLGEAAALLAAHPDIPAPYITASEYSSGRAYVDLAWYIHLSTTDLAEQKRMARQIVRALGGKWDKVDWHGDDFTFRQERDGLKLDVQVKREAVCERVVTGVEIVTIPAKPAEAERTEEREVVEWRCEPLLAEAVAK